MQDITKTFTIQWVGPFKNMQQMKQYLGKESTCDTSLFNFYYFSGNKKGRAILAQKFMHILEYIRKLME